MMEEEIVQLHYIQVSTSERERVGPYWLEAEVAFD